MIDPARRVRELPRYVFEELQALRDDARAEGVDVIDLTVGNPDGRPPESVIGALVDSVHAERPSAHGYPPFAGTPEFRRAIARWYQRRFGVELDATREILPVVGTKEGLYHLAQTYLDPGDAILVPTPCYPAYLGAARLAEAEIVELPLLEQHGYLLQFEDVPTDAARAAKLLLLNYPNNPTGAVCDLEFFRDAVAFCRDHDILLVSDIAYSELGFDPVSPPPSVLQLPGAKEIAIEFQSLSKSHSMAGWRVGFCAGNGDAVGALRKLKSNVDFGLFRAVQDAAVAALDAPDAVVAENRRRYRSRRDRLCAGLGALGWSVPLPPAAMYVWTRVPPHWGDDDAGFVRELFARSGVLLSPGRGFGRFGRGYVRLSLVVDEARLDEVVRRIEASGVLQAGQASSPSGP